MKIDVERLESCEAALTVEVDPDRLQAAMKQAARRLSEKNPLPGFRKGKAPYALVVRHFGEEYVRSEAIDSLGQKVYEEALDQAELEPYSAGSLTDITLDPLVYKFTVPLQPEVELGDYRAVRLPYAPPEVTDEDLEKSLEHLREHHAVLEPVERPAQLGDVVTIDVAGTLTDTPEPEFLMKDDGVSLLLDAAAQWPLPGIAERLIGIAAGEERQIEMSFPEDYANDSLKGRPARFAVTASAVKSRTLPEWDDALAKEIGEFETLLDLRVGVRKQLQQNAETAYRNEYANSVKDIVAAGATVQFPPVLLEQEIDNLADDLDRRLREQNLNLDDYLKLENRSREALREELRPRAEERLKWALVLGKVIQTEDLDLEPGAVEQRIQAMSQYFGQDNDRLVKALSSPASKRSIALDLLTDRAMERLVAIARGEAPPAPGQEAPAPEAQAGEAETQPVPQAQVAEAETQPVPQAQAGEATQSETARAESEAPATPAAEPAPAQPAAAPESAESSSAESA